MTPPGGGLSGRRGSGDGEQQATGTGAGAARLDAYVDGVDGGPPAHRYQPYAPARSTVGPPLAEVTAHRLASPDHWHLVTRGLSDLDDVGEVDQLGDDIDSIPGWGFELTFRVTDTSEEPAWAVDLLTNLAAYVWTSGHPFAAGHHLDLRGPIRLDHPGPITAAVVVVDPTLGVLDGPHGPVEFLQLVGLRAEELELCRSWSTEGVVELLGRDDPLLVCRLNRPSVLDDPQRRAEAEARSVGDGSALTELRVATSSWRRRRFGRSVEVEMGAGAAAALGPALQRELIGQGASFCLVGDDHQVRFTVADPAGWTINGTSVDVSVPAGEVAGLAGLFDGRTGSGRRQPWSGLRWRVVP